MKNLINIGIPSKGRLRKDVLKIFTKKKLKLISERGERDLIGSIKDKSKSLDLVLNGQESAERDVPDYIDCDQKKLTAKLTRVPKLEEVPYPVQMEPNLVVEFYSRN